MSEDGATPLMEWTSKPHRVMLRRTALVRECHAAAERALLSLTGNEVGTDVPSSNFASPP